MVGFSRQGSLFVVIHIHIHLGSIVNGGEEFIHQFHFAIEQEPII